MNNNQFRLLVILQVTTIFLVGVLYIRQADTSVQGNGGNILSEGKKLSGSFKAETGNNYVYGKADAPNEVIVFTRYNCSYCRDFYLEVFPKLRENFIDKGLLKVVFMDNVNPSDKTGMLMARVAEIGRREKVYDTIQENLYSAEMPADSAAIIQIARNSGIGEEHLEKLLGSEDVLESIRRDNEQAFKAEVRGTPTFLINGKSTAGFIPYSQFEDLLED